MLRALRLAHYRFTLIPESTILMPAFNKGSILGGVFGTPLRKLVCPEERGVSCDSCAVKDKCAYSLIFNPVGTNSARRLKNVPRGYVLKPPIEEKTEYLSSKPLSFEIVLIGDRIDYLPHMIVPFIKLGKVGIGLNRGRFTLSDISVIKDGISESIYDPESNTVKNVHKPITGSELLERAGKINRQRITLEFLTPTRIKYNHTGEKGKSEVVMVPEFHHVIRSLRDRVNALSVTYCGSPINVDFKGIEERAMQVKTRYINLRWFNNRRKSRTQPIQHDQSGFVGKITFEGELKEFLPLLLLGEYVHVGENAVFGNGWYRIR